MSILSIISLDRDIRMYGEGGFNNYNCFLHKRDELSENRDSCIGP